MTNLETILIPLMNGLDCCLEIIASETQYRKLDYSIPTEKLCIWDTTLVWVGGSFFLFCFGFLFSWLFWGEGFFLFCFGVFWDAVLQPVCVRLTCWQYGAEVFMHWDCTQKNVEGAVGIPLLGQSVLGWGLQNIWDTSYLSLLCLEDFGRVSYSFK